MTAYALGSNVIQWFDRNTVSDLLSDTGDPVPDPASDSTLAEFLQAASGQIEGACSVSGLYTPTQLAALTGNALSLLHRLVCTLAMVMLAQRRPEKFSSEYWQDREKWVEDYCDQLRKGQRLFDDPSHTKAEAGLPSVDGPSAIEYQRLNLIPDRTRNYYPSRVSSIPLGRG